MKKILIRILVTLSVNQTFALRDYFSFGPGRNRVNPENQLVIFIRRELVYPQDANITFLSNNPVMEYFTKKTDCIICQEKIKKKEINLTCGHEEIHKACLEKWMRTKFEADCPICRRKIVKK